MNYSSQRVTKKQQVVAYYKANPHMSQAQLADLFLTDQGNISKYLQSYNIEKRIRRDKSIKELHIAGISNKDISSTLGIKYHTVYRAVKAIKHV